MIPASRVYRDVRAIRGSVAQSSLVFGIAAGLLDAIPASGVVLSAEEVAQIREALEAMSGDMAHHPLAWHHQHQAAGETCAEDCGCCLYEAALALLDGKPDAAGSSKGRTPAFEAEDQGSSPCPAVKWEATVRFDASAEMASMVLGAVHDAALRLSETAVGSLALLDGADEEKP